MDSTTETNEAKLITRIVRGEIALFAYFLRHYGNQVFSLIVRLVGNAEDAEELRQDTFLKAYRNLSLFRGESSFQTWLMRIAYNSATDFLRKQRHMESLLQEEDTLPDTDEGNALEEELESLDSRRVELLHQAIGQLSAADQVLITQFYLDDRPLKDVAYVLNITPNAASVRLIRIKKKLYQLIKRIEANEALKRR